MAVSASEPPVVLAVDDEPGIRRILQLELTARGFRLVSTPNVAGALDLVRRARPNAILLDIVLPDGSGLDILPEIRRLSAAPVILLTARDRESDRRRGLSIGADAFVVKPFESDELAELLRRLIYTNRSHREGIVRAGPLEIDLRMRTASRDGVPLKLGATEWHLLEALAASADEPVPYTRLLSDVWDPGHVEDVDFLHAWMDRLRSRLNVSGDTIAHSPGQGYTLITAS